MAGFPDEGTALAFGDLTALTSWLRVSAAVFPALEITTGPLHNHIHNLSLLPPAVLRAAIAAAKI